MNICFLIYNISNFGGSERVTALIANEFSKRGHNVTILSLCGNNECKYDLRKNIKVNTLYINKEQINYRKNYIFILNKLYKYYKKNKIEISIDVFTNMSMLSIPIKLILKFKNITWEHFNFYANNGKIKISRRMACKYSNALITLTNEDVKAYKENIKKVKCYIDYIYNPTPFPNAKHSNMNNKNVITVGRLTYQKGYDMLLNVWKKVTKKNKEWSLLIVGTGEDELKLKEQKENLNLENIYFEGAASDIQEYYQKSSIFVSSSRDEGLPMCMIEAQSFGIPIVAFNCKTGPSEIIENGQNGFLIENQNCDEMAEKLLNLMQNRETLLQFASKASIDNFKIDAIVDKWNEVIKRIER